MMECSIVAHIDGLGESSRDIKSDFNQGLSGQTGSSCALHVDGIVLAHQILEGIFRTVHQKVVALRASGCHLLVSSSSDLNRRWGKSYFINYKLFGTHSQIISNSRACQQHRLVALKGEGSLRVSRSLKIGRSRCHNQGLGRSHASCDGEGASSGPSLNRIDGTAMDGSRDAAKHDQNRSSLHGV